MKLRLQVEVSGKEEDVWSSYIQITKFLDLLLRNGHKINIFHGKDRFSQKIKMRALREAVNKLNFGGFL